MILFGEGVVGLSSIVNEIKAIVDEVFIVYNQLVICRRSKRDVWVSWKPLSMGWFKLNTDGMILDINLMVFGEELIRYANGCWSIGL